MKKSYVYKITRKDGLEYIGISVDVKRRFAVHEKSNRFAIGIDKKEILSECDSYEEAEDLEEKYISEYDTYNNGLNLTEDGKSSGGKFNTLGHKFSDKSKKKMSLSAKIRGPNTTGFKHSKETKENWSKSRKGKVFGTTKLNRDDWIFVYKCFRDDTIDFGVDYLKKFVKKTQRRNIDKFEFHELKGGNGKPLTKETLYANYFAEKYNMTQQAMRRIIKKKGVMSDEI
tara:strand:+ start:72 stop:755 length:684 start_codon:yes stop_codon:yes gene_type:complete